MADSALIDDLEKQFADNPRRVFARLANEYRKAGDPERAIEICRHHVPQQPGYISGHIVLGQALFDTGQFDEARSAFETALGLDPENLIALRQLGDIARETGDLDGAGSWYRRLLEVDPQNEEVAEQLQALAAASDAMPPADAAVASEEQEQVHWGDIHPEDVPTEPTDEATAERDDEEPPSDDTPLPFIAVAPESGEGEGEPAPVERDAPESQSPVADIALDTSAIEPASGAAEGQSSPAVGIDALAPEAELTKPAAPAQEATPVSAPETPPSPPPIVEDAAAEPSVTGAAAELPAELAESDEGSSAPADTFVTETMAELYVRQGFVEKALDIYRQLARQSPNESRFQSAIDELEQTLAAGGAPASPPSEEPDLELAAPVITGPTIREFLSAIAARHSAVSGSAPSSNGANGGAAADSGASRAGDPDFSGDSPAPIYDAPAPPSSVTTDTDEELFPGRAVMPRDAAAADTLAGGYMNGSPADDGRPGAPARTASDELSLDAVFRAPSGNGERSDGSHVSFDQFFSSGAPASDGAASEQAGGPQPEVDGGAPSDLELFHAWLEGLKK